MDGPALRRRIVSDAGIEVLAAGGPRALTHRAVDVAAGLPAGSTSYYFRTRRALLEAVIRRLAERNREDAVAALPGGAPAGPRRLGASDLPAFVAQVAAVLDGWLRDRRPELLARYACMLEAARDPELRDLLAAGQPFRDDARALLAALGAPDAEARGRHFVAFVDGLVFDRVAGAGALAAPPPGSDRSRAELADALGCALRGLLAGGAGGGHPAPTPPGRG